MIGKVSGFSKEVHMSFDQLPEDDFMQEEFVYRFRRFSKFRYENSFFIVPGQEFFQSREVNTYAGGVVRSFAPLECVEEVKKILEELVPVLPIDFSEFAIGVHQIRIVADDEHMGKGAPEGIHQDGFAYECHVCVRRENVNGGVSLVFDDPCSDPVVEHTLHEGEFLFLHDEEVYHYVTPFTPRIPGQKTYRDMFIIAFERL